MSQLKVFSYLSADKAAVYRRIMECFVGAKERYQLHLRSRDVARELEEAVEQVEVAMTQLCDWGNLERHPDTAEVSTVQEFNRPRYLFGLTPEGEAAEAAVRFYHQNLEQPGELQVAALGDILTLLSELLGLAETEQPDQGKVHLTLKSLDARFGELTSRAQTFISGLQRAIDLHGVEVEVFLGYKQTLLDYLERFIQQLVLARVDIARTLETLAQLDVERLLAIAAGRDLADAVNPTPQDHERARDSWTRRWAGLVGWFSGPDAQAEILRARARAAIPALLATVAMIHERRASRSDRSTDFRRLAQWFAETDSDAQAHQLWRVAFSLSPSRHYKVDEATLDHREAHREGPQTSWLESRPLTIAPRLRATGRTMRPGALNKVVDRSDGRRELALLAEREAEQMLAARRRLATGREMRLSQLGTLGTEEFDLFLELLGEALATELDETTSADGSLLIRLRPTGDGETACIHTGSGTFRGPDHYLTLEPV